MRILLFSDYYHPDGGSAAPLFTMLSEELVQRGHMVTVITTVPHYPSGKVPAAYKGWSIRKTVENGVCIIRLPLPSVDRKNLPARFFQFIIYQILSAIYSLQLDFDVFVGPNPALEVWLPFMINAVLRQKPAIYSIHEIYPDVGIKLGIFKGKFSISLVTWLEKSCLSHADRVRILSKSFLKSMQSLGVDESKIELIYDWVEIDNKEKAPRNNSFSSQYDLDDTFNIVYAGNMGVVQGLETIIDTANILREDTRIRFIFIGDGAAKPNLIEKVRQLLLSNIIFVPYQPRDKMPEIWASADAALVILRKEAGFYALPSKTFSILANALPIIACIDYGSDTWDLVQRSESGLCVPPEDPAALAQAILSLKGDLVRSKQMGQNGRAWAEKYHSPQAAATHFESLFQSILGTKE